MKVLVACEFSGIVRDAFIAKGHDAWSVDLEPSERPGPHIQGDVLEILNEGWDLMIAFPPCTHLSAAGAQYWPEKKADGRQGDAIKFVRKLFAAPIKRKAIENPVGILSTVWRKPDQICNPFQFGDPFKKKTCFWLEKLQKLKPTQEVEPRYHWTSSSVRGGGRKKSPLPVFKAWNSSKDRSRTFPGISLAMAEQWGAA